MPLRHPLALAALCVTACATEVGGDAEQNTFVVDDDDQGGAGGGDATQGAADDAGPEVGSGDPPPGEGDPLPDEGDPAPEEGDPPPSEGDDEGAEEHNAREGYCYDPAQGWILCDGGPSSTCEELTFQGGETLRPRILLVVDKSGSMAQSAAGYGGSKWGGLKTAIGQVVTSLDDKADFGLMLFPNGGENSCAQGALAETIAPNNASSIVGALGGISPAGGTPTADTLARARDTLDLMSDEGGPLVVVLATDGGPNCNGSLNAYSCVCTYPYPTGCENSGVVNCLDDIETIDAAEQLNAGGYAMFVVAIPGVENFSSLLNGLAEAGGTALPGAKKYYDASDTAALAASIEAIAERVTHCRFDIPGDAAAASDLAVSVGGAPVPRDETRADGWDLVDADTVELFGDACEWATSSAVRVRYCDGG